MDTTLHRPFYIKASPLPLMIIDRELKVLEYSKAILPFFELSNDVTIVNLLDILEEIPPTLEKGLHSGETYTNTLPIISRNGNLRWIRTSMCACDGKLEKFQLFFDDVTQEKTQYELAVHAQRIAKIGSWKVDLIKNAISWSEMTRAIHEVSEDYVPSLEEGINFYKEGKHRDEIIRVVSECLESGTSFDVELIIITAKGNEKWVRAIGEAEQSNGKTIGFYGVFQDIDEIKREKIKNEILNDRMRVAVQSANIGIWDWDVENDHLIWDDNMFALCGVNKDDFEGAYDAWESVVHPEDKEFAALQVKKALEGEKTFDTEFRVVKQDGSIDFIQGKAQVFRDDSGKPLRMVGINTDITKLKQKDKRLRKLLEVTEKQNQKLINFAHIVSHNLRSNSSNISMLSGMLLSGVGKEKTDEFLDMIRTSSEKLEETLNQLNETVKIQGTKNNDLAHLEVKPILEDVCKSINTIIKESKAEISIKVDKAIKVWGIKSYLTSVFLNLLTNSIKYHHPEKVPKIQIQAEILNDETTLVFKDNGSGIDLKKHGNKLFGMYKTFHGNKDAKGIGLFMAKNQMEAMNGRIEVKSEEGKGATFLLYFKN